MKILITGVAGFLGSHIADKLIDNGHEVLGIDNLSGGYIENVNKDVNLLVEDLKNYELINSFFEGVDIVIHAACTAYEGLSVFSPYFVTSNTYEITSSTLSASINKNIKKFIYLSSMSRYGTQDSVPFIESMTPKPQDPYGIAKYASELTVKNLCETHGIKYTILVPHNIIGPRQKYDDPYRNVASIMTNRILNGKPPIIYGDGNQKRCFSFIDDVVDPILLACDLNTANGMTINVGPDDQFITINELAKNICNLLNYEFEAVYLPERLQEVKYANCSADLARKILGYEPKTKFNDGLKQLVGWISKNGPKNFMYNRPIEILNDRVPRFWKNDFNE